MSSVCPVAHDTGYHPDRNSEWGQIIMVRVTKKKGSPFQIRSSVPAKEHGVPVIKWKAMKTFYAAITDFICPKLRLGKVSFKCIAVRVRDCRPSRRDKSAMCASTSANDDPWPWKCWDGMVEWRVEDVGWGLLGRMLGCALQFEDTDISPSDTNRFEGCTAM